MSAPERWTIYVLGATGSTILATLIPGLDVLAMKRQRQLNGIATLSVDFDRASTKWSEIVEGRRIQLVDLWASGAPTDTYRIAEIGDSRDERGFRSNIRCDHITADLVNSVVKDRNDHPGVDPTTILSRLLAKTESPYTFTLAAAPTSPKIAITTNYNTLMRTVQDVADQVQTDWRLNESLGIALGAIGTARTDIQLRHGQNLRGIRRTRLAREMVNRQFPVGAGMPPLTAAEMLHTVTVVNSTSDFGFEAGQLIASDGSYDFDVVGGTPIAVEVVSGGGAGNSARIDKTYAATVSANYDRITTLMAITGIAVGSKVKLRFDGASTANVDYQEDGQSIAQYGLQIGPYENQEYFNIKNLVTEPLLDGTYTGGVCAGWSAVSTPTLTENTDDAFIKYGTKSQKVVATADGQGVQQTAIPVTAGREYVVMVNLWVTSGSVRVEFDKSGAGTGWLPPAGFEVYVSPVTPTNKFQQIALQLGDSDRPTGSTCRIRVLAHGGAATFYVDAAQVTEGPGVPPKFVSPDDISAFWRESMRAFRLRSTPAATYEVEPDLYLDRDLVSTELALGDAVSLVDLELGINADVRLVAIAEDIVPTGPPARMEFATVPDFLARRMARTADYMQRLAEMQRMLGVTSQRARESRGGNFLSNIYHDGRSIDQNEIIDGVVMRGILRNVAGTFKIDLDTGIITIDPGGTASKVLIGQNIPDQGSPDTGKVNVLLGSWVGQTTPTIGAGAGLLVVNENDDWVVLDETGLVFRRSSATYPYAKQVFGGYVKDGVTFLSSLTVPTGKKVIAVGIPNQTASTHGGTSAIVGAAYTTSDSPAATAYESWKLALYEAANEGTPPSPLHHEGLPAATYTNLRALWFLLKGGVAFSDHTAFFHGYLMLVEVDA